MSSTPKFEQHVRSSELTAPIELIELDATLLGGPIYRFAPMPIVDFISGTANMTSILWNGFSWPPFPLESSEWAWDGMGAMPTPHIKVGNVNAYFTAANIEFGDLLGVYLTRFRTFEKFLDGKPDADPNAQFPPEIYRVERKISQNNSIVEWELSNDLDHAAALLPGRIVLKNACTHIYRTWNPLTSSFDYSQATCPYTGSAYFTSNGAATSNPADDMCSKKLGNGCKARFGQNPLPTRAFPGAGRANQG